MAEIKLDTFKMQTDGTLPNIGDKAPDFILARHDLTPVGLEDFKDKNLLLNIFPSIDTSVCFTSVKRFHDWAETNQHDDITIACVSMDLPYALDRIRQEKSFTDLTFLSDFRDHSFGASYGVLINTGPIAGLLARAVILIDKAQTVRYVELVEDVSMPCDYHHAQQAISALY